MSICQYLAMEVHKPLNDAPKHKVTRSKKPIVRKSFVPTVNSLPTISLPQPPSRIVSQIMEMGFPRRRIEYAIQVK